MTNRLHTARWPVRPDEKRPLAPQKKIYPYTVDVFFLWLFSQSNDNKTINKAKKNTHTNKLYTVDAFSRTSRLLLAMQQFANS